MLQETKYDSNTMVSITRKCWRGSEVLVTCAIGFMGGIAQIILEYGIETPKFISTTFKSRGYMD
jgi:hypothetical protein